MIQQTAGTAAAIWQHQLGTPLPAKIFAHDGSTNEVQLRGSFNGQNTGEERSRFLKEVSRILSPAGKVMLHMLTGDMALSSPRGSLPGPASYVTYAPALAELLAELEQAEFEHVQITKYGSRPCFTHDGVELRETMLEAQKRVVDGNAETRVG